MSQSELYIQFSFIGTDKILKGTLTRLQCPMTIQKLYDKATEKGTFTCRSRGNIGLPKAYLMFLVELKRGAEKKEDKNPQIGDIVYCPRQDAIFIIYDTPKLTLPVYHIGVVTEGLEHLKDIRNGTMVKIEFLED